MKLVLRLVARAMATWRSAARELKHSARLLAGTVTRMLFRQLGMAFHQWRATALQMRTEMRVLTRCVASMTKKSFSQVGPAPTVRLILGLLAAHTVSCLTSLL